MIRSTLRRLTGDRWPAVASGEDVSCAEVARRLQHLLDDEIDDPAMVAALSDHLEACRRCGLEAETYRSIKTALENRRPAVPSDSVERLRQFGTDLAQG